MGWIPAGERGREKGAPARRTERPAAADAPSFLGSDEAGPIDVKHAATNFAREQLDDDEEVEENESTTAGHGRRALPVKQLYVHIYTKAHTHTHTRAVADERGYMAARVLLLSVLITEVLKPACAAGACRTICLYVYALPSGTDLRVGSTLLPRRRVRDRLSRIERCTGCMRT